MMVASTTRISLRQDQARPVRPLNLYGRPNTVSCFARKVKKTETQTPSRISKPGLGYEYHRLRFLLPVLTLVFYGNTLVRLRLPDHVSTAFDCFFGRSGRQRKLRQPCKSALVRPTGRVVAVCAATGQLGRYWSS